VEAPPEPETNVAAAEQYEDSTADEVVNCEDSAIQAVGRGDYAIPGDADEEPSQESVYLVAEPAMSFATSFTSSFTL
jgi:hypothetical protein